VPADEGAPSARLVRNGRRSTTKRSASGARRHRWCGACEIRALLAQKILPLPADQPWQVQGFWGDCQPIHGMLYGHSNRGPAIMTGTRLVSSRYRITWEVQRLPEGLFTGHVMVFNNHDTEIPRADRPCADVRASYLEALADAEHLAQRVERELAG
jgi:hypothetical protein